MSQHQHQLIDLLEIYHARTMRDRLCRELARLHSDDAFLPGTDPARRDEIRAFYESMLTTNLELLGHLGD